MAERDRNIMQPPPPEWKVHLFHPPRASHAYFVPRELETASP